MGQVMFCSPCINIYNAKSSDCQNNICINRIEPDTVMETIERKKFLP